MSSNVPDLISAALFERGTRVLTAHRKTTRPPFAGQWLLPMTIVADKEGAEDALRRHAREQFGVELGVEQFIDTVYLDDPDDQHRYVANIFRASVESPMRFNAEGDYDDARWAAAGELNDLWMPPALREPLVRIMREAGAATRDAAMRGPQASGQAIPLGEAVPAPPDNRAAWDAIAEGYQAARYGERFGGRLMWSWRASEDDLHVLGDMSGKRAIVLGCGGGQDVVALARLGAVAVGIDSAAKQIAYARRYGASHEAPNASFVEGDILDLSRFDDESFDLALSIHALEFVEDAAQALAEAARVLKPGGVLAIATKHPFDVHVDGGPPYTIVTSYWTPHRDWTGSELRAFAGVLPAERGPTTTMCSYYRTMQQWSELLATAGFTIERLYEPREGALPKAEGDALDDAWLSLMPYTLVIKARRR